MIIRAALVLLLVGSLSACASAGTGTRGGSDVITEAELADASQTNLLDFVQSVRPHWLRYRGSTSFTHEPEIVIYVNGTRAGGPDVLSRITPMNVEEVHYYSAAQAQYRFGVGNVYGAIDVTMKRD